MIHLTQHSPKYLALRSCYEHRDAIKMLADYPDVQWSKKAGAWLVDSRLWDDLALALGKWLCATPDFWMTFSIYAPPSQPRRRSKREVLAQKQKDNAAAAKWGQAIVEMGKA